MGVVCSKKFAVREHSTTTSGRSARVGSLLEAAANGNIDVISKLLRDEKGLVNACDYDMRSALHLSCAEGHMKIVECLLQNGANAKVKDRWGTEPLQEAMLHGHQQIVARLRDSGVKLSDESISQLESKLCTLAVSGDLERIKSLVKSGVSINAADYDSRSVLHLASSCGHVRVVEYLVDNDADVNAKDIWGCTPFNDALRQNHTEVQEILVKAGAVTQEICRLSSDDTWDRSSHCSSRRGSCGETPSVAERKGLTAAILDAAAAGDVDQIAQLLAIGAGVNDSDYDRRSSLHLACSEGRVDAVEYLIGASAEVDLTDRWGHTPLHDAVLAGHIDVAQILRRAGAALPADSQAELEAQMRTLAAKGDAARLGRMLDCGLDPNAADSDGRGALHLAAATGHAVAATVLLSRGADVDRRDRGDNGPLELALVAGHEEVASALRLGGAQTGLPGPRVVKADALRCGGGGGARV
jgi:ankyrin repeat protein